MREHLGGNVYAEHDGHSVMVTHEDGQSSWTICLQPRTYEALVRFVSRYLKDEREDDEWHEDDEDDDWDDEDDWEDEDDWCEGDEDEVEEEN